MTLLSGGIFIGIGGVAGVLSGLLGIGGGLLIVPALLLVFRQLQLPYDNLMHIAAATSLAIMAVSASISTYWQHRHGNMRWHIVLHLAPGIVLGVVLGSIFSQYLPGKVLRELFALFVLVVAIRLFLLIQPKPGRTLPNLWIRNFVGLLIGAKSGALGLGGGAITVPFLVRSNISIHQATACSAACSMLIATLGTFCYLVLALAQHVNLPNCSGYIYWPAFFCVALTSCLCAPYGVRWARRLPTDTLKRIFACFLLVVSLHMFLSGGS